MLETALWPVSLAACVSAMQGDRAAWALLLSMLYATTLDNAGVPFNIVLWGAADLAVLAVLWPMATIRDELIAALFVPAWFAYFANSVVLYEVCMVVVIAQFTLVLPWSMLAWRVPLPRK